MLFVTTQDGQHWNASTYSKAFRTHLAAIGLSDYHFHGLRHTTGTALAENGATSKEIQSILNHKTLQMSERYTKRADQKRLARSGMAKLEQGEG